MYLNRRNKDNLENLFLFCELYKLHRDFDLAKKVAKNNPLSWKQAESLADLCNMLIKTKTASTEEFISTDDDSANEAIEKYKKLKEYLDFLKKYYSVPKRNQIYKAVKKFYRKRMFCYQMDSYFTYVVYYFYYYTKDVIDFDTFINDHYFSISLFDGKKKPINFREVVRIHSRIKDLIQNK